MAQTNQQKSGFSAGLIKSVVLAGLGFAMATGLAHAQENADQDVSPNFSVSERFAQQFAVPGIRSGSFVFFPVARYTQIYDDNIFSAPTDKTDDLIGEIFGELALRSDWDIHDFSIVGDVRRLQYFDNNDESTTDYSVRSNGRFFLNRRAFVSFDAGYSRGTEARRELQTANGIDPVRFSVFQASIGVDLSQNRFREQFGVSFTKDNYNDAFSPVNGIEIDQDFRDREAYDVFYRQLFRVRPTVAIFGEVRGGVQQFDNDQVGFNANQDSQSYGGSVGIALDINKVARGEIGVGYQFRNFDSDLFDDISGVNIDASLEYFLSDLTTVTLIAERSIQNTAVVGFAGFYSTGGEVRVEHELLRRVMLVGSARYTVDDFRDAVGFTIDRTDKFLRLSGGVQYAFRPNVVLGARYIYNDANSTGADARPSFNENIAQISLEFRR